MDNILDELDNSQRSTSKSKPTEFLPSKYKKYGLSEKDVFQIKEVFDSFNLDGRGYLSPIDLRSAFKKFGNLNADKGTIYHLISEFDEGMLGELTFEDFIKVLSNTIDPYEHSMLNR